jgi:hypothetical protein
MPLGIDNLDDGCTAGPLSNLLNQSIKLCCDLHDKALDHTFDLGTFISANWDFFNCVYSNHPWLAPLVFVVVAGPAGLFYYYFGAKRNAS